MRRNYSEFNIREKQIRNKITIISFFCSMLVIWIHTYNLEVYGITEQAVGIGRLVYCIEKYWSKVTQIAVPMFFFVSGFLFFRTFTMNKLYNKYKSRIQSLLIPYLCWCTLYYLYFVVISNITLLKKLVKENDVVTFSIQSWINSLWRDSYYTLWFIKNLMIFVLITPIVYLLLKNWKGIPSGTAIMLFCILNSTFNWISVPDGLEMYALGSWIAINYKEKIFYNNNKIIFLSWIFILIMMFTSFRWLNVWTQAFLFVSIWFALDIWEFSIEFPWWMHITFFIYVAHDVFLEAFEKILWIVGGNKPIFALLDYLLMPGFVVAFLIVLAYILRKYVGIVWKVLNGGR